MANIRISDLTAAGSAQGTQQVEVNESGTSKRVTIAQIVAYVKSLFTVSDITDLTATAAELNTLDGVTATTAEINKLDGVAGAVVGTTDIQTLTNKTLTSPTLTTPTVNVGSDATGDLYYRSAGGVFTRLPAGTDGQVLSLASGVPTWVAGGSTVTSGDLNTTVITSTTIASSGGTEVYTGLLDHKTLLLIYSVVANMTVAAGSRTTTFRYRTSTDNGSTWSSYTTIDAATSSSQNAAVRVDLVDLIQIPDLANALEISQVQSGQGGTGSVIYKGVWVSGVF